jgi:hypothetical protein
LRAEEGGACAVSSLVAESLRSMRSEVLKSEGVSLSVLKC